MTNERDSRGPWIYHDPEGHRFLVELVPMPRDPGLSEDLQPMALVFNTDDGWIRVTPVGHDFHPERLSREELFKVLQLAAGKPQ